MTTEEKVIAELKRNTNSVATNSLSSISSTSVLYDKMVYCNK